jgi:hypothetical protein
MSQTPLIGSRQSTDHVRPHEAIADARPIERSLASDNPLSDPFFATVPMRRHSVQRRVTNATADHSEILHLQRIPKLSYNIRRSPTSAVTTRTRSPGSHLGTRFCGAAYEMAARSRL